MAFVAHKREDGTLQTIRAHLDGTAEHAKQFAAVFDAGEQGSLVGLAHDIGKYSAAFQRRILEDGPKTDHSTAGAFECAKDMQLPAAFCVAGHHSGLPDLGGLDDYNEGTLRGRLRRAEQGDIPDYSAWETEFTLPEASFPKYLNRDTLTDMFFVRMLYSCLVDADYLDTERFMSEQDKERGSQTSMEDLDQRLDLYIQGWFPPKSSLNEKRCQILESCIQNSEKNTGLFTLTVPTGGGKTVASLTFAIKHAKQHGLRRVIYVVPYTSIIEQTAKTFRNILGSENVLEHHSGVEFEAEDRVSEEAKRLSLATENWDMPVIVTTAVQFFESLFACRSSRCRKNHNIAGSVVIFDEAQMLPIPYLRPCVYVISQLVQHYHVTAVLCTATQPALDNVFKEFISEYEPIELCPEELANDPVFKRTQIEQSGPLSWIEVSKRMNQTDQILCIVNSRKNAREIYSKLSGEGCFHLSTLMIPVDRRIQLNEIRRRLQTGEPCRVVSTSLIEAGVDVDFPIVLREEAGLDSVIQAAGRCNREGKRNQETSIVTVFQPQTRPPVLFRMNIAAARAALRQCDDISDTNIMERYYRELLLLKGKEALDKHDIIRQSAGQTFPFRSIAEQFHLIEQNTVTVYIPVGEGAELLKRRLDGEISRRLMRKLSQYSVSIYPQHFETLRQTGAILPVGPDSWYLCNLSLYDRFTGLSLGADDGKAEFI